VPYQDVRHIKVVFNHRLEKLPCSLKSSAVGCACMVSVVGMHAALYLFSMDISACCTMLSEGVFFFFNNLLNL